MPVISAQPQSQTVTAGQTVTFGVTAGGSGPLAYQWRRNGLPISGATQGALALAAVSRADADSYDVVVSSGLVSTVSGAARLSVAPTNYPGQVAADPAWSLELAGNNAVGLTAEWLADGRAYLGGAFVSVNGLRRTGVMRVLADGSVDSSFVPAELENQVWSLLPQADGKLIVGGDFVRAGGVLRARLARLNADGSLDAAFGNPSGVNGSVLALVAQPDGKVIVAGAFRSIWGSSRSRLARLNADGTLDGSFVANFNNTVNAVAVQADGRIVVGGIFTTHTDVVGVVTTRPNLIRLNGDGTVDASFVPVVDGAVQSVAIQADGQIVAGGAFLNVNAVAALRVARLKADGTNDAAFLTAAGSGFNASVFRVAVQADGKIVVGGEFSTFNGSNTASICRLNADGTRDTGWLSQGFDLRVRSLAVHAAGRIIAVGDFSNYRDATGVSLSRARFARLNADGTLEAGVNVSPLNFGEVNASLVLPGGKLLVAGYFTRARGAAVSNGIMRLNADGSVDASFNPSGAGANGRVMTMARQGDGKIVVGGNFTLYNGFGRDGIARLNADGTLDTGFNAAGTGGRDVYVVAAMPGGGAMVGGTFTTFHGASRNRIALLNPDGTLNPTFDPGAGCNDSVLALVPLPDGRVVAGGSFTTYSGAAVGRIMRLNADGTLDTGFNSGGVGADRSPINAIAVQPDGKLVIGGNFRAYNAVGRGYVARLNADGTLDSGFTPAALSNAAYSLLLQEDGKILVRGIFGSVNSQPNTGRLVRLNADGTLDTGFAIAGLNEGSPFPNVLAMTDSGQLAFGASNNVDFLLTKASGIPAITGQPVSQVAGRGDTVTFSITLGSGGLPASYQWYFGNAGMPGATNAVLTLSNVQAAQAGGYRVQVTNELGSVFSSVATLAGSGAAPVISAQPQSQTVTAGQTVTFGVTAGGSGPLAYQWRRNGLPISGATQGALALAAVSRADADSYDVVVSSGLVSTVSGAARLSVAPTNYPGQVAADPAWSLELAGNNAVGLTAEWLADGRAYLGGAFVSVNGLRRTGVMRVLADGSVDSSFVPAELENQVWSLLPQADGKLIVGGDFVRAGGVLRARLARLNADGSLDAAFGNPSGVNGSVLALVAQPDGKLLVGGAFGMIWGSSRSRLARLNADGTLDGSFVANFNNTVNAVAVQADGRIVVGGIFTTHTDVVGVVTTRPNLIRLNGDGTVDASFVPVVDGAVQSVAIQADGQIVAGGAFLNVNAVAALRVARLKADGTNDAAFLTAAGSGFNASVFRVAVQADGKIVVGGEFSTFNGSNTASICRLNADGTRDTGWLSQGFDLRVRSLAVHAAGRIIAVGDFSNYRDATGVSLSRARFARLNADGTLEAGVNVSPLNFGEVNASLVLPGGKLLVAGYFTRARGAAVSNGIMRLNADGSVDASFNPSGAGANGRVMTMARQGDGKIVVGGNFTLYNGFGRDGIARLNADGTLDTGFNAAGTGGRDVYVVAAMPGGGAMVGGTFTTFHGASRNRIALLNPDGTLNPTFDPGAGCNDSVLALVPLPDGRVVAGGSFTTYSGAAVGRIMRLNADGTLDTGFNSGGVGADGAVQSVVRDSDGGLMIGGWFGTYNGISRGYLARLNANGSLNSGFTPIGLGWGVYGLIVQEDGKLFVRGLFGGVGGPNTARLLRLNADGTLDTGFAIAGLNEGSPFPNVLAMTDSGQLAFGASNSVTFVMTKNAGVPTITAQPESLVSGPGGTATFSVAAVSGSLPTYYQWYYGNVSIPGATTPTLVLAGLQPEQAGGYRVYVSNDFGGIFSSVATLAGVAVAPAFTVQPQGVSLNGTGGDVTFSSVASGVPNPSYQWYFNGAPVAGATNSGLTLKSVRALSAGRYWVVAANIAGSASSAVAVLELKQPGNSASHAVEGGGYLPGSSITVSNTLTYSGMASALSWAVLLPPGWSFLSAANPDAGSSPAVGQTDLIEWAWSNIPPSPVNFSYTLSVPHGQEGNKELVALAGVRNGDSLQFLANPDPLVVTSLVVHSADTDRNFRIALVELTRVIELYNTRNGTNRTGAYAVATTSTEDGFAPDSARASSAVVTLTRYHSADSNRDGKLSLLELTRVIELYNYRSGTTRTGQYKVQAGTEDGFAPGP